MEKFLNADNYNVRYRRKQIAKALVTARRALKGPETPVAKVAAVLNPYMDCTEIEGLTGPSHEDTRSEIFALMADAYRCEGNVELAAKWYRRASQLSPGGHALVYAHIVCKHQLAEFYDDALKTLQEHQRHWRAKPIITRILRWLRLWFDRPQREIAHSEKQDLAFLLQRVVSKAA